MTEKIEVNQGPAKGTIAAQALEELKGEGHTLAPDNSDEFDENDGSLKEKQPIVENAKEEAKALEDANIAKGLNPDGTKKEEKPVEVKRDMSFVPAYKLKIVESQKEATEKELADAKARIESLSKQPDNLNTEDKKNLEDAIKILSEKHNVDPELLKDIKSLVENKNSMPKDVEEKLKLVDTLLEEKTNKDDQVKLQQLEISYTAEFEKDVLPLLKVENPKISDEAILKIKEDMKVLAFSEGYNILSLKKIWLAEKDSFKIPTNVEHRKTTEDDKSGKTRSATEIDFDNMSEEKFKNLSDADTEKYLAYQRSKGPSWKK